MDIYFSELLKKEVISLTCGKKYGCPRDIELDCKCGNPISLIMPCRSAFSLFSGSGTYSIPWCDIERIGQDVIWIKDNYYEQHNRTNKKRC